VIRFASGGNGHAKPALWEFFDYKEGNQNPIERWYQALTEEEQDVFESLLKTNGKAELPTGWTGCKMLQGEAKSEQIWEWRFTGGSVQHRLLGIFGPGRKQATFLIGCNHKQHVYQPRDCIITAIKRARAVREGRAELDGRTARSDQ